MRYIARNLEKVVLEVTKEYPVVLVTGPRQVGKTTMLQKLMEGTDRNYVSLDDLNERNLAKTDPEMFLQLHKPPILIDEVQYAPELFAYIKIHVDKYHNAGDFWLAGSQVFKLMSGIQESLAGRAAVLSLTSLSQAEICGGEMQPFTLDIEELSARRKERTKADTGVIFDRIFRGSMPAIVSEKNSNSQIFYSSYLTTYIERDVRELSDAIDSYISAFYYSGCCKMRADPEYCGNCQRCRYQSETGEELAGCIGSIGTYFLFASVFK